MNTNHSNDKIFMYKNHVASALFSKEVSKNKIVYDINTLKELNKRTRQSSGCVYGDTDAVFYHK